jgi:tetratricopeptide (TPR) repeat protein
MADAAALGLAECDEAQFKLGDALKAYENFAMTRSHSFLYAQAIFGKGRCLEQMSRFDEARAVYEDFITAHPKDPSAQRAETALMYVGKAKRAAEKRALQPPAAAPQAAAPAPAVVPAASAPVGGPAQAPAAPVK